VLWLLNPNDKSEGFHRVSGVNTFIIDTMLLAVPKFQVLAKIGELYGKAFKCDKQPEAIIRSLNEISRIRLYVFGFISFRLSPFLSLPLLAHPSTSNDPRTV
jgi:hypothetical protein